MDAEEGAGEETLGTLYCGTKPGFFETLNHSLSPELGSERLSVARKRAKGRASSPVITSRFKTVLNHSGRRDGKAEERGFHLIVFRLVIYARNSRLTFFSLVCLKFLSPSLPFLLPLLQLLSSSSRFPTFSRSMKGFVRPFTSRQQQQQQLKQ